jgi:hypothetical protein
LLIGHFHGGQQGAQLEHALGSEPLGRVF